MTDYKCRAECPIDIVRVRKAWKDEGVEIENEVLTHLEFNWVQPDGTPIQVQLPDQTWEFTSAHSLDDLIRIAKIPTDCHVIVETLKHKADYTGNRDRTKE
jgi:hypothetical protein